MQAAGDVFLGWCVAVGLDGRVRAVCHFAESYADQSERDHAAPCEAIASGRSRRFSTSSRWCACDRRGG